MGNPIKGAGQGLNPTATNNVPKSETNNSINVQSSAKGKSKKPISKGGPNSLANQVNNFSQNNHYRKLKASDTPRSDALSFDQILNKTGLTVNKDFIVYNTQDKSPGVEADAFILSAYRSACILGYLGSPGEELEIFNDLFRLATKYDTFPDVELKAATKTIDANIEKLQRAAKEATTVAVLNNYDNEDRKAAAMTSAYLIWVSDQASALKETILGEIPKRYGDLAAIRPTPEHLYTYMTLLRGDPGLKSILEDLAIIASHERNPEESLAKLTHYLILLRTAIEKASEISVDGERSSVDRRRATELEMFLKLVLREGYKLENQVKGSLHPPAQGPSA